MTKVHSRVLLTFEDPENPKVYDASSTLYLAQACITLIQERLKEDWYGDEVVDELEAHQCTREYFTLGGDTDSLVAKMLGFLEKRSKKNPEERVEIQAVEKVLFDKEQPTTKFKYGSRYKGEKL